MSVFTTTAYTTDKATPGQRRIMLAAVDAGGRLPDDANRRVLNSIPETWARTDAERGGRFLTAEGRAVLAPLGRFLLLAQANPETGALSGSLGHFDLLALARDGLVVVQDAVGAPVAVSDRWNGSSCPRITERGRRLVGMPLTAPPFAERHPVGSRAMWKREGEPAMPVQVLGWPLADGTVRVRRTDTGISYAQSRERPVPAEEIHPVPEPSKPTVTDNPDGEKTMPQNTPDQPKDLDQELEKLRELAAQVRTPLPVASETWEAVKALEERATAGWELADRFAGFDAVATGSRRAPQAWRIGREVTDEEIPALIEKFPELEALGGWVKSLSAVGFAPFQMANLVRKVQAHRGGGTDES